MTISDENKKFLEDLLQYYIDQADSYSQIASEYGKFSKSKREIAFSLFFEVLTIPAPDIFTCTPLSF